MAFSIAFWKIRKLAVIIFAMVSILVVSIPAAFAESHGGASLRSRNSNKYQAVFLTNNQTFFGKLSRTKSKYAILTDVYYLTAKSDLQSSDTNEQQFSLVKLGEEVHGPEDVMYINTSQILWWENLRKNSRVVQGIAQHKAKVN